MIVDLFFRAVAKFANPKSDCSDGRHEEKKLTSDKRVAMNINRESINKKISPVSILIGLIQLLFIKSLFVSSYR